MAWKRFFAASLCLTWWAIAVLGDSPIKDSKLKDLAAANPDIYDDIDLDFDPTVLLRMREADMNRSCPTGIEKCECENDPGTFVEGPFNVDTDPLGTVITFMGCNPGHCFCKGDPINMKDTRPEAMKAVLDACPKGEMNRCLCHDNKKVFFPFDMRTLFLDCRPKRCKCNNSKKVKVIRAMGCKNGGTPYCPRKNNLYCKDGTHLDREVFLNYKLEGHSGCICRDGIMPRCLDTGDVFKCPDGSDVDWTLGGPQDMRDCKVEEFSPGPKN